MKYKGLRKLNNVKIVKPKNLHKLKTYINFNMINVTLFRIHKHVHVISYTLSSKKIRTFCVLQDKYKVELK